MGHGNVEHLKETSGLHMLILMLMLPYSYDIRCRKLLKQLKEVMLKQIVSLGDFLIETVL